MSNADQAPQKYSNPFPFSLLALPEDIVLRCLSRIPRSYYLNLSLVSKTLRSLVRSPELNRLRSLLHNKSLHIGFQEVNGSGTYHWLTLRPTEKTTIEYRCVPFQFPAHLCMYHSLAVSVGSKIYFVGRSFVSANDLWILDTRSGKFTQGPSMKVCFECEAVGVIDGKIYVIGVVGYAGYNEKIQVQVFDPELNIWKSVGREKVPPRQFFAWMDGKIYMVENGRTRVYNPKEGKGERMVHMVSKRLVEYNQKERLREQVSSVCVVENVLYACYEESGLMWFDTKLNVWRRLVNRDGKEVYCFRFCLQTMVEYEGKLAVFESYEYFDQTDNYTRSGLKMFLIALDRIGEKICGTVEWYGIVATIPNSSYWMPLVFFFA